MSAERYVVDPASRALLVDLGISLANVLRRASLPADALARTPVTRRRSALPHGGRRQWEFFGPELRHLSEPDEGAAMRKRVRAALLELLPVGVSTMQQIAQHLAVSTRTLHSDGCETSARRTRRS